MNIRLTQSIHTITIYEKYIRVCTGDSYNEGLHSTATIRTHERLWEYILYMQTSMLVSVDWVLILHGRWNLFWVSSNATKLTASNFSSLTCNDVEVNAILVLNGTRPSPYLLMHGSRLRLFLVELPFDS